MQTVKEIIDIVGKSRPSISFETREFWANYLIQLTGCHVFSAACPEEDKECWLRDRCAGIGGSEIAAIMGINPWTSPRQIWMDKVGMIEPSERVQSEAARWGNLLETTVAEEWARRNNKRWVHIPIILQHNDFDYLLANIDGLLLSDDSKTIEGILEIKTTSEYNKELWENGPVPEHYIYQANWYCGITGLKMFTLVCLVGGQKLYSYDFPFNAALFEQQKAAAKTFWEDNIKKGIEPLATDKDLEALKGQTSEEETPPYIPEDDTEAERLIDAYITLGEKISALKKVKDSVYAQLFGFMGAYTQAVTSNHILTINHTARRSCNYDLLAERFPDAYEECIKHSSSTTLRIK